MAQPKTSFYRWFRIIVGKNCYILMEKFDLRRSWLPRIKPDFVLTLSCPLDPMGSSREIPLCEDRCQVIHIFIAPQISQTSYKSSGGRIFRLLYVVWLLCNYKISEVQISPLCQSRPPHTPEKNRCYSSSCRKICNEFGLR